MDYKRATNQSDNRACEQQLLHEQIFNHGVVVNVYTLSLPHTKNAKNTHTSSARSKQRQKVQIILQCDRFSDREPQSFHIQHL